MKIKSEKNGENSAPRRRIEYVELHEESEGPDFYTDSEFQVIDNGSGKIMMRFWSHRENGIGYSFIRGTKFVELAKDNKYVLVTDENDNTTQIPLE